MVLAAWVMVISLTVLQEVAPGGQILWLVISFWVWGVTVKTGLDHFRASREDFETEEGKS